MFWYVRDVSERIRWVPDFCRQTDWACCVFAFLIMTFRVESYSFENMNKKNLDRGVIPTKNSNISVKKMFLVYFWRIWMVVGKNVCLNKMCRADCVCLTNKRFKPNLSIKTPSSSIFSHSKMVQNAPKLFKRVQRPQKTYFWPGFRKYCPILPSQLVYDSNLLDILQYCTTSKTLIIALYTVKPLPSNGQTFNTIQENLDDK